MMNNIKEDKLGKKYIKELKANEAFKKIVVSNLNKIFPDGWRYDKDIDDCEGIAVLSTMGWYDALSSALKSIGREDILEWYDNLDYYNSDLFDGDIEDKIIKNYIGEGKINGKFTA